MVSWKERHILFLCYGEGKQKQTLAQKIVFIILSFYSGLVERFPEIRQLQWSPSKCLVKLHFVQRGNTSITVPCLYCLTSRAEHLRLISNNLLLIPLWYGATVESPIRSTIKKKKRKNVLSFCLYKVLSYEKRASHLRFVNDSYGHRRPKLKLKLWVIRDDIAK